MPIRTRVITTDGSGAGAIGVSPAYFAGAEGLGSGTVSDTTGQHWTEGMVARGDETAINGGLTVAGAPASSKVTLYFDF